MDLDIELTFVTNSGAMYYDVARGINKARIEVRGENPADAIRIEGQR